MVKANSFLPSVENDKLFPLLYDACKEVGIDLQPNKLSNYRENYRKAQNVITWGYKIPTEWYNTNYRNTLYLENGLFCQRGQFWIDSRGKFSFSKLCECQEYFDTVSVDEMARIHQLAHDRFKWNLFEGYDNSCEPYMFALQRGIDAPARLDFPLRNKKLKTNGTALEIISEHFPDLPIIWRGHPRFPDVLKNLMPHLKKCWRSNWSIDTSKDCYKTLKNCRGLITINSTLATETLFLGIPVATLGRSAFTGSNVTLECHDDPSKLSKITKFVPDQDRILNYLGAVMRHQLPTTSTHKDISEHREFQIWAQRAK
ncbi:TPA: hypothetical protein HA278_00430 [Candidatus Woesearchaeota archaeon]|nr:hypothetical protein [Candidatus Woesearchaeota archaeon]